jgi:hypothetical protein
MGMLALLLFSAAQFRYGGGGASMFFFFEN